MYRIFAIIIFTNAFFCMWFVVSGILSNMTPLERYIDYKRSMKEMLMEMRGLSKGIMMFSTSYVIVLTVPMFVLFTIFNNNFKTIKEKQEK